MTMESRGLVADIVGGFFLRVERSWGKLKLVPLVMKLIFHLDHVR